MPESISTSRHPVGLVVSPGTSRTTSSRQWAFYWTVVLDTDPNRERRNPPIGDDDPS